MKKPILLLLLFAGLSLAAETRPGDIAGLAYPNARVDVTMKNNVRLSGRLKGVNSTGLVLVTQTGLKDVVQVIPHNEIESVQAIGYKGVARRGARHIGRIVRFGVGLPFYVVGAVLE